MITSKEGGRIEMKKKFLSLLVSLCLIFSCMAIPSLAAYAFFRRRAAKRIAELEEIADEVLR